MYRVPDDEHQGSLRPTIRPTERARAHAKELRAELSPPERVLWSKLRREQLHGFKFRKQHPMGPWIADFYCHEAMLVVEIDGSTHHGERKDLDDARDQWMTARNIGVLRVTARDVFENLFGVLSAISRRCHERVAKLHTRPPPPPDEADERTKPSRGDSEA
jgi:very-short-patch-repair endonuclease